jgi:hypothetical protein
MLDSLSSVCGQPTPDAKDVTSSAMGVMTAVAPRTPAERPSIERPRATPVHVAAVPTKSHANANEAT